MFKVGDKVYFMEEKRPYTVRACDERYLICTKPFNLQHTVQYTIVDLKEGIRGADNYWRWGGYDDYTTDEGCRNVLENLNSGEVEISYRNRIPAILNVNPNHKVPNGWYD